MSMWSRPRSRSEAEAERLRSLGLVVERGVVKVQLLERVAQRLVLVGLDRIEPGEHLRLDLLEPGSGLAGFAASVTVSPTLAARSSLIPR